MDGFLDTISGRIGAEKENEEGSNMRGYYTSRGFYGLVNGKYMLFADETEYYECVEED